MKHVKHPDLLFLQIQDRGWNDKNLGIAFTDKENADEEDSLDMNDFDEETLQRVLHNLRVAYSFVYDAEQKLTGRETSGE